MQEEDVAGAVRERLRRGVAVHRPDRPRDTGAREGERLRARRRHRPPALLRPRDGPRHLLTTRRGTPGAPRALSSHGAPPAGAAGGASSVERGRARSVGPRAAGGRELGQARRRASSVISTARRAPSRPGSSPSRPRRPPRTPSASRPGTRARRRRARSGDPLARLEGDGRGDVGARSGGVPACASPCESAIEKQAACAAAISSSGLVAAGRLGLRARAQLTRARRTRRSSSTSIRAGALHQAPCQVTSPAFSSPSGHHLDSLVRRSPAALELEHLAQRADRDLELVERRLARRQPLEPEAGREQRHRSRAVGCLPAKRISS